MMYKRKMIGGILIAAIGVIPSVLARPVCSGDVLGRDMDVPVVGRIGHLAMGTGDDIYFPTNMTIEVEPNGSNSIVWGKVTEFKKKTRYWGSRGGLIMVRENLYRALNEGKRQSFWCPHYAVHPVYDPGEGWFDHVGNPHPTKCGTFRCDTFVGYIMSAGGAWQIRNNMIQLPYNAFMTFPYPNGDTFTVVPKNEPTKNEIKKDFVNLSIKEINDMSIEDISPYWTYSEKTPEWIAREWELLADDSVKPMIRWGIINIFERSHDEDIPQKFINIFDSSHDEFIKTKLVAGLMMYYQNNWEQVKNSDNYTLIKKWYEKLLEKPNDKERSADLIRGYIDFHEESDINANLISIERHLSVIDKRILIGLQFELIRKSESLQKKFLPKTIRSLNNNSDTELDSMAFHYLNHIKIVNDDKIKKEVVNFVKSKQNFYKQNNFTDANTLEGFHAKSSSKDINELLQKLQ